MIKRNLMVLMLTTALIITFSATAPLALTIVPGTDTWVHPPEGTTVDSSFIDNPLPADFFGPGSDPFDGTIPLTGSPCQTPLGDLGPTDMIVERTGTIVLPSVPSTDVVDIEIIALSLVSTAPITVSFNGGGTMEEWDVQVYLSSNYSQIPGSMAVTQDDVNSGRFTCDLPVIPRYVFTRVLPPGGPMIWDDGRQLNLSTETFGRWASVVPAGITPVQSTGSVTVDHDGNGGTAPITVPAGNTNFFAGLFDVSGACGGMAPMSLVTSTETSRWDCMAAASTILTLGAGCMPDGGCVLVSLSCATTLGIGYYGDGSSCFDIDCLPGLTIPPGTDTWTTPADGGSSLDMSGDPIPASFFGPGSDPFDGQIALEGIPLETTPPGALGNADMIVERIASLNFPDVGDAATVPIEIVALSLRSTGPITVTYEDGISSDHWAVDVFLSSTYVQDQGPMLVTQTCSSGGTFEKTLPIIPRLVFTRVELPHDQFVLDDGRVVAVHTSLPGDWTTETPSWISPNQSDGSVTVDHDGDAGDISSTAEVTVATGSNNFFAGICMEPCEALPTEEICAGMCIASFEGYQDNNNLQCLPSVTTSSLHGATCLDNSDCMLTTETCASQLGATYTGNGTSCFTTDCSAGPPHAGVEFYQVDYMFPAIDGPNSKTGRLEINVDLFMAAESPSTSGYLNVYTDLGWAVQNLWLDLTDGVPFVSTYFEIGTANGTNVPSLSAFVSLSPTPILTAADGARAQYLVLPWIWNAEGGGNMSTSIIPDPMPAGFITFFPMGITTAVSQPNTSNVQTATNQCFPMSIANSLQYLEDRYGLPVPHDHKKGLDGDNSLVGQLDEACNRNPASRTNGPGVWFQPMVNGKFKYLKDNNLEGKIVHRHQGAGYGGAGNQIPPGDYSSNGITSTDESVGGKVTWEWICDQIANGEDVEIVFTYDNAAGNPTGGHAVRVFECGKTFGVPWIGYVHDGNQTGQTDAADTLGLETPREFMFDSDGDGHPNVGSANREIRFAFSESADNDRDGIPDGLDNSPHLYNPGQEDGNTNDIGDVGEGALESDLIGPISLASGESVAFGPFPNPLPLFPEHKDLWFEGIVNTGEMMGCVLSISFDYVIYPDDPVVIPDHSIILIPPGVSWEIFSAIQFEFCPDEVSVHFEVYEGEAFGIIGELNHICYPVDFLSCCIGIRGNANGDDGEFVNISDVTYLVDYLFGVPDLGPPPPCQEEGNANGDEGEFINISDVTYLVDYLFGVPELGPPPPPCPTDIE